MKEIDKIAWILIEQGKILGTRTKGRSNFYIPGGKSEKGESDEETLIREIREGLSVSIKEETINYLSTFKAQSDNDKEGILVKMTCYEADYEGTLKPENEIEEMRWLTTANNNIISEVDKIIYKYLKEKGKLD